MMKINNISICFFLVAASLSCSSEKKKYHDSPLEIDKRVNFCQCLNDFDMDKNFSKFELRILACLGLHRSRLKDEVLFIQYATQNCPDFFYHRSKQEIIHAGYDLDNFKSIQNEHCERKNLLWGQNPIYFPNSTMKVNADTIEHFQNGILDQTVKYLFSDECTSYFEVIEEINNSHILLNVGDTFSRTRIAYYEDLFLVEFRFKNLITLELENANN